MSQEDKMKYLEALDVLLSQPYFQQLFSVDQLNEIRQIISLPMSEIDSAINNLNLMLRSN